MKQYERHYMKDPMFLMGISYGLLKGSMLIEVAFGHEVEPEIYDILTNESKDYKEEAKRRSQQLKEAQAAGDTEQEESS